MSWRSRPGRRLPPTRLRSLLPLLYLLSSSPSAAGAAEPPAITLPEAASLPWRLVKQGSFVATQFRVAQLHGSANPEFLGFGRELMDEDQSCVLEYELEPPFPVIWQHNFPKFRGGLAGGGDLDGDGTEELIFWRYDAERQRLDFWVEHLRRGADGAVRNDTLLVCAGIAARHSGSDHEQLPRSLAEGRILAREDRILVQVTAGFNWRQTPRGLLVYDLQGALRTQIRLPNNTFGYRFADLDGDARRELFLSCYASGNGDSCARGDDGHSYWRVLDLEGHDRLGVQAGGFATLATTQPLRPSARALPLVLASLSRSQADELRLFDGEGQLVRVRPVTGVLNGSPLVVELDDDGAEDILIGLGDGSLLRLDARLEERARWRFPAAVQPLYAADLAGDARPELVLRIGDELLVCDRELEPLARWPGWLTDRLMNPLAQVSSWQAEDGLPRLALVGLLPNQVGILRLERNPWLGRSPSLLIAAGSLLLVAALAIAWLARDRRRLAAMLQVGTWRDLGNGLTDEQRQEAEWLQVYKALFDCGPRHGRLNAHLISFPPRVERLRGEDSARHRQDLAAGAEMIRGQLPGLRAIIPLARRLLGDDLTVDRFAALLGDVERDLAELETREDPRAFILGSGKALASSCLEFAKLSAALLERAETRVQRPVLDQILRVLPELKALAAAAGARFDVGLAGPLERLRPKLPPDQFGALIKALVEISLTRAPNGARVPLRLAFAVEDECLKIAAATPGCQDGVDTAARWEAFPGRELDGVAVYAEPDALCLRVRLQEYAVASPRGRAAAAGLLLLAALLAGPRAAGAADSARPLEHDFLAVEAIHFPPGASAQLRCADIEGDTADNALLLLRDAPRQASWLLVERQQGHAWVDTVALAGSGDWGLVGAEDLDDDGRAEILLSYWQADTLELHRLWFPSAAAAVTSERLLALPAPSQPASGAPRPGFTQARRLAASDRYAFVYAVPGGARPAGILAYSLARGLLWRREFSGPARLEDLADRDGDGRPELLIAVAAGPAARGPGAGLTERPDASCCLDLDDEGRTLSSEACGGPGSQLRRFLLRNRDLQVLGELRLLRPEEASPQGTRVEYRPADGAAPLALEPGWRCQAEALLDLDGDGSEEFVLAIAGLANGRGELIAFDRRLHEIGRRPLAGRPQSLRAGDLTGGGHRQLLVVLPDDLLLVDRALAPLAQLRAGSTGVRDIREAQLCAGGARKPAQLAVLGAGQLLLLRANAAADGEDASPWESVVVFVAGGLLGAALALWLLQRRGARRRAAWLDETPWQARAALLGRWLDLRDHGRLPQRLNALKEACLFAAAGDADAAQRAGEARTALQQELTPLLAVWPPALEPAGRRRLEALLACSPGTSSARDWQRQAGDMDS